MILIKGMAAAATSAAGSAWSEALAFEGSGFRWVQVGFCGFLWVEDHVGCGPKPYALKPYTPKAFRVFRVSWHPSP